jgi:hypothetical protein
MPDEPFNILKWKLVQVIQIAVAFQVKFTNLPEPKNATEGIVYKFCYLLIKIHY